MNLQDLVQRNGWGATRTAGAATGERLAWIGPVRHVRAPGGPSAASGYCLRGVGTPDRSSRSFATTTMLLPPGVPGRAPWHPGRFLRRNYLTPLGLSQTEAARRIAVYEHMANLATRAGVDGTNRVRIRAPFISFTKAEIIQRGLALGVDYGITQSCYDPSPDGTACGHCDACQLRLKGFRDAGVADPAPYL